MAALLSAAQQRGLQIAPRRQDQGADALGTADLMGGKAQEIQSAGVHIERQFTGCLHGVGSGSK